MLTHIFSYLHVDSQRNVGLVSKRFYSITTTQHLWRMAFFRYFPGHQALQDHFSRDTKDTSLAPSPELILSEARYFSRLTALATWRSEYLFRTTLLSSLARGKPSKAKAGIDSPIRAGSADKKSTAVLTYNSRLPWTVTCIDAIFENGNKGARAIHGASMFGVATMSDPTNGKVSKWGFEETNLDLDARATEATHNYHGLGSGPAATDNVMDVSQAYGMLAGQAIPGGKAFYRAPLDTSRIILESNDGIPVGQEDVPHVPSLLEGISSVWIAKSAALPTISNSMIGMFTGSTLGIVTAYAINTDPKFRQAYMTVRWAVSPGVPIISIKVDDNYSVKRKAAGRIWAVALNALGEVYYLDTLPLSLSTTLATGNTSIDAWKVGYAVPWKLLRETSRTAMADETGQLSTVSSKEVQRALDLANGNTHSSSSPVPNVGVVNELLRCQPTYFRQTCQNWDMRRRLEVDFAADDGHDAGEHVFVLDCGHGKPTAITRFTREVKVVASKEPEPIVRSSIFGGSAIVQQPSSPQLPNTFDRHHWVSQSMGSNNLAKMILSASALDNSTPSLYTLAEDPLCNTIEVDKTDLSDDTFQKRIPGRRARYLVVGTECGAVLAWNSRARKNDETIQPIRVIQTSSPKIQCVAASSLYIVHGGSDGLVQAWDPLASMSDAVRTLNSKSTGPIHRRLRNLPALEAGFDCGTQAGAIFMDPDATNLRGIVSFGWLLKCWSYSAHNPNKGRKRRTRHSDAHARLASRRQANHVSDFIAEEEKEMIRSNEERRREVSRMQSRFGAFGDLTEEEALEYAQILSSEAFAADEQRRASDSGADLDTASSFSDVTPEPSIIEQKSPVSMLTTDGEDEYDEHLQQALRLSLMETVEASPTPARSQGADDFDFVVKYKPKGGRKAKTPRSNPQSPSGRIMGNTSLRPGVSTYQMTADDDLAFAISLSLQDQEGLAPLSSSLKSEDDFPALNHRDGPAAKGKGKAQ